MKIYLLFLLSSASLAIAETYPSCPWAARAGGGGDNSARSVALDPSGSLFVAGAFSGAFSIGSSNFTSIGSADIFLAKYDSTGKFLWARQAGGDGDDFALGVAADSGGNFFVTGSFQNSAVIGASNFTAHGGGQIRPSDVFIAKYGPIGAFLWARAAGGNGSDQANAIALDAAGDVYLTGSFDADASFGTNTLVNASALDDIFVVKCSSTGEFLWARKAGDSITNNLGSGIAVDGATNVYVTGYFGGTVSFGSTILSSAGPIGLPDIYLAKYDAFGNLLWVRQAGGQGDDRGNAVAADAAGNVSLTGQFNGTAYFGPSNVLANGSGPDIFVARYNTAGNLLWVRSAGGNSPIYGDAGFGICTDSSSNAFVTGYFSGHASFGSTNLSSIGFQDVFCAKYDPLGNLLWVRSAGGPLGNDFAYGIAADNQNNSVLSGLFLSDTISFDAITLTNSGNRDVFMARLSPPPLPFLSLRLSGAQVILSWPTASSGFVPESTSRLRPAGWTTITATISTVGTNYQVTLPSTNPQSLFRLRR